MNRTRGKIALDKINPNWVANFFLGCTTRWKNKDRISLQCYVPPGFQYLYDNFTISILSHLKKDAEQQKPLID